MNYLDPLKVPSRIQPKHGKYPLTEKQEQTRTLCTPLLIQHRIKTDINDVPVSLENIRWHSLFCQRRQGCIKCMWSPFFIKLTKATQSWQFTGRSHGYLTGLIPRNAWQTRVILNRLRILFFVPGPTLIQHLQIPRPEPNPTS